MLKQKQAGMPPKKEAAVAHVAPPQEGPGGAQPPDPSSGRSDSSEAPERSALASVSRDDRSLALAPVETIVDAELHCVDLLLDVCVHRGDLKTFVAVDRARQGHVSSAEIIEVILELGRPVWQEGPFHAGSDRPAGAGFAARKGAGFLPYRFGRHHRGADVVFVVGPGDAALHVA